ncbi:MAG: hypothetical protein AB8G77_04720 [Rhodothermales bacterium]
MFKVTFNTDRDRDAPERSATLVVGFSYTDAWLPGKGEALIQIV